METVSYMIVILPKMYTCTHPVSKRRHLDVDSTFFEIYGRQMDVKTTLCVYWVGDL